MEETFKEEPAWNYRHRDTGEVVKVNKVKRCCGTCRHAGGMPDGVGECAILLDYVGDELQMTEDWNPETQSRAEVPSHSTIGPASVCKFWEEKPDEGDQV